MATPQLVVWKKRVLVPFWAIRICIMLFLIAAYALLLRVINTDDFRNMDDIKDLAKPATAVIIVFLCLIIVVLLLDVLAIILFLRDALHPGTFLTMNCFQTGFWAVVLIMDLVAVGKDPRATTAGIGFVVFIFLTFVGLLIYSIVNFVRAKKAAKRGQYAQAHNPAAPTPGSYNPHYYNAAPYPQQPTYPVQTGPAFELQGHHPPPYQGGAATDFYSQPQPKPANMV